MRHTRITNPQAARMHALCTRLTERRLDALLVTDAANLRALTGLTCDSATLVLTARGIATLHTDFRYVAMVHRVAPWLRVSERHLRLKEACRLGVEFSMPHKRLLDITKNHPRAKLVDISEDLRNLRAVKTEAEIADLRAAEALVCTIWNDVRTRFRAGMTERDMARMIKTEMINRGEGEAFDTIVCIGAHAAECHHEPDDTVWNGREGILVDMGVRLNGVCSDLTRNIKPARASALYKRVYDIVRRANIAAIEAARPGMTGRELDAIARRLISREGFGRCFGHSLGHGVGYEIHEAPTASRRSQDTLKPGMLVTIEPGIYLEDNLGVRIEDFVLITENGCEVLSNLAAK